MKEKINIAEILKDKPQGTKLYSSACGKCELKEADDKSFKVSFYSSKFGFMNGGEGIFDKNGNLYDDGECIVFPSKEMRDWSKFAWKKGDVLVSNDGKCKVIFERFDDDTYTSFVGKYYVECYGKNDELQDYEEEHYGDTVNYTKESEEAAQTYINTIEERLGGKLNMETLEIDKTQPEFKDGDVVCISGMGYLAYGIVKSINNSSKKLEYYVLNDMSTLKFEDWLSFEDKQIQPITETQQIILFDALAKKGKAWDAEKKAIVDLKPKVELKPFDKVLVRDNKDQKWKASFFGYKDENHFMCENGCAWFHCIPYEGNEHLLGTTKDVEG
jgi:hypothetical protein